MNWLYLNSGKGESAFNMAMDEALLESVAEIGAPILRFYGWQESAATFGYFQKFSEVARSTHLRPLIRRATGGGIVPHDADWTYSFVAPPYHEWHSLKAEESYRRIHDWICAAFGKLKIETELAAGKKTEIPGACFAGWEKSDLLWRGKKIAGAAQRRNKLGLLIQGSVQPPAISPARADWENAMLVVAEEKFKIQWQRFSPGANWLQHPMRLSREKYSQTNYNQRR